jgi:exodeoxyribonuclease V gamma subunit
MLHLYQSNRLEDLYTLLSTVLRLQPLANPFSKEVVVVQSKGMGRWLNFRLAQESGIAANINYPLPASFFWDILNRLLGEQQRRSPFSPDVMTFRIMRWLETVVYTEPIPMLRDYLENGSTEAQYVQVLPTEVSDHGKTLRRYALAAKCADIFDQYLVYRPDWLMAWEAGKVPQQANGLPVFDPQHDPESVWQAMLWRALSAEVQHQHRAHSLLQLQQMLDAGEGIDRLPARVTLVGISNLPPVYMDILRRMAQHIDVLFFAINPCAMPWGEIRDTTEQERLAGDYDPAELYLDVGHPLLASWGKQGRDFFDSLIEEVELHSIFECAEPEKPSLLNTLQHDILMLNRRQAPDLKNISKEDDSVQVHVCHSPMREVEVLHDQLLGYFNRDTQLLPSHVVVLTPDIETYAPLIEAVFAPRQGSPTIPYSIADRSETRHSPCVQTFLECLHLPESRFQADWVLALLDTPAIRSRFELEEADQVVLRRWVEQTHICWGRDAEHKGRFGLPETPQNAWKEGLSRMLIGIALPCAASGESIPLYEGLLPFDDIEGQRMWMAARFSHFVETLFVQADLLAQPATLSVWSERLQQLLDVLFQAESDEESTLLRLIREKAVLLGELEEEASYHAEVDIVVIRSWMAQELESFSAGGGFLTGGVTFCTMVPMRSLPFKRIALLGMQEGAFPRPKRPLGFDLIARHPRKGDRARRADDRFLFLETLLSAREGLYISYVGKDIRTDQERPPSVLVSDLLDAISEGFILEHDQPLLLQEGGYRLARERLFAHVCKVHPLQSFSARYFLSDALLKSYSLSGCRTAEWVGRGRKVSEGRWNVSLSEPGEEWRHLECDSLFEALLHPTRYVLKERYGFTQPQALLSLPTTEPFNLDFYTTQRLRRESLPWIVAQKKEQGSALARASGLLPHGAWGEKLYEKESHVIEWVYEQAEEWLSEAVLPPHFWKVAFKSLGLSVSGCLNQLRPSGLVVVLPQSFSVHHQLRVWLQHLALCHEKPSGVALITRVMSEDGISVFRTCDEPEVIWKRLLELYWSILFQKTPLFKRSSAAFAAQRVSAKKKKSEEALERAIHEASKTWNPQYQRLGEWEDDLWLTAVWQGIDPTQGTWQSRFIECAEIVWEPLYQHYAEGIA